MKLIAIVTHQRKIHFLWQQKRLLVYFTQSSYSELSHSFTGQRSNISPQLQLRCYTYPMAHPGVVRVTTSQLIRSNFSRKQFQVLREAIWSNWNARKLLMAGNLPLNTTAELSAPCTLQLVEMGSMHHLQASQSPALSIQIWPKALHISLPLVPNPTLKYPEMNFQVTGTSHYTQLTQSNSDFSYKMQIIRQMLRHNTRGSTGRKNGLQIMTVT